MLTANQRHRYIVEALARLTASAPLVAPATAALRDGQPGYPTATGGGGSPRLDAAGNPPGLDRYLAIPDPYADDQRRLDQLLPSIVRQIDEVQSILTRHGTTIDPTAQPTIERTRSGGDCLACGRYCSGNAATDDRLRAGLCSACRMHWRRWSYANPTRERGEWMLERRRSLADDEEDVA